MLVLSNEKKGFELGDIILIYQQILRTNREGNLQQKTPDQTRQKLRCKVHVVKEHVLYHLKSTNVKMYLLLFC